MVHGNHLERLDALQPDLRTNYGRCAKVLDHIPTNSVIPLKEFRIIVSKHIAGDARRIDRYIALMVAWKKIIIKDNMVTVTYNPHIHGLPASKTDEFSTYR